MNAQVSTAHQMPAEGNLFGTRQLAHSNGGALIGSIDAQKYWPEPTLEPTTSSPKLARIARREAFGTGLGYQSIKATTPLPIGH